MECGNLTRVTRYSSKPSRMIGTVFIFLLKTITSNYYLCAFPLGHQTTNLSEYLFL